MAAKKIPVEPKEPIKSTVTGKVVLPHKFKPMYVIKPRFTRPVGDK